MQSEADVRRVFGGLDEGENLIEWAGDNFKYGFLLGKLLALEWLLGGIQGSCIANGIRHDYTSWQYECERLGDQIREGLKGQVDAK